LTDPERWVRAGIAARPHGLDGSFHVVEPVADLLDEGALVRVAGEERRIDRRAGFDARPILRLEGVENRAAAEVIRGEPLLVFQTRPRQLDDDEYWAHDLEGCAVRDGEREVGVVTRLLALPSCEVLEVARVQDADPLLVPLVKDAVRVVDLKRRVIDVDLRFLGEA